MSDLKRKKRVVVTGLGTVNPLGTSVPEFWQKCVIGSSGVQNICHLFEIPPYMSQIAGVVPIPFCGDEGRAQQRNLLFAQMAAKEAIEMAEIKRSVLNKERCGVFLATAIGEISLMEQAFVRNREKNGQIGFVSQDIPYPADSFFFNHVAKSLSALYEFRGGAVTIATGCTGGNDAIGYAMRRIRNGEIDLAITGAVEAPITPLVVAAFSKIGATSKKRNASPQAASRPFDKDRDGFVLAEGCGILILESLDHAVQRGVPIYAEICGFGSSNNCYHMTDIPQDGSSIAKASMLALQDAGIQPQEIDFVNLHGSSTPQNDIAEANALKILFKERLSDIPVTSIKSQLGHALSAANSLEVISAVKTLNENIVPPTINLENQDPACPLSVVANRPLEKQINSILKTSSGFSGIHSSLVLRKVNL